MVTQGYALVRRGIKLGSSAYIYWAELELYDGVTIEVEAATPRKLDNLIPKAVAMYYRDEEERR